MPCGTEVSAKILVVEDDAIIAMAMAELLTEIGHTVCAIAETELEAVTAAAWHHPDLMIVDANLREGSGIAAVIEILRTGFVPHIFVTGDSYGLPDLRPGTIVIHKPFTATDLAHAIQRSCVFFSGKNTS